MPSAFLNSKVQDIVSDYCSRNGVSDCHKAEVAHVMLSLSPLQRVYLAEAINMADRDYIQESMRAMSERVVAINTADDVSSKLVDDELGI